jgi:serine/threonine protein kinase
MYHLCIITIVYLRTDQFEREKSFRTNDKLDSRYVVGLLEGPSDKEFEEGVKTLIVPQLNRKISDYPYCLVMPHGERNLREIYLSERPDQDEIRTLFRQLVKALQYMHNEDVIHGDPKMINIVRVNGHLRMIDLDASTHKGDPIGCKLSSAIQPPEMWTVLSTDGKSKFEEYWNKEKKKDSNLWVKIMPRTKRAQSVAIKTFRTDGHSPDGHSLPIDEDSLPYKLVEAAPSFDVWACGLILYNMLANQPLLQMNRDDDLLKDDDFFKAAQWTDTSIKTEIDRYIGNLKARLLLYKLLHPDPTQRMQSMDDVLADPYLSDSDNNNEVLIRELQEVKDQLDRIENNTVQLLDVTIKMAIQLALTKQVCIHQSTNPPSPIHPSFHLSIIITLYISLEIH